MDTSYYPSGYIVNNLFVKALDFVIFFVYLCYNKLLQQQDYILIYKLHNRSLQGLLYNYRVRVRNK